MTADPTCRWEVISSAWAQMSVFCALARFGHGLCVAGRHGLQNRSEKLCMTKTKDLCCPS
jgi:hypothetical protein